MKGLREKFRNKKGFTLVEMLIVVAIIAILIAVSIPMVSSALEKARHATDEANNRSAMALGSIKYLNDYDSFQFSDTVKEKTFIYTVNNAHQGILMEDLPNLDADYTAVKPQCKCNEDALKVTIAEDGTVSTNWSFDDTP